MKKNLAWIVIGCVVLAGLIYGLLPQSVWVEAVPAVYSPLTLVIEEEGKTRVVDRYQISAPVAGFARRVDLDIGDEVKVAQVLTELEPLRSAVLDPRSRAEASARVSAAKSSLAAAEERAEAVQADAEFAASELGRKQRLSKTNSVSEESLQQAEIQVRRASANLRSAKFAVEVGRHELEAAQTMLQFSAANESEVGQERVAIRSPVSGSVLKVFRESEGVVTPGSPLLEVGNPRALEIAVDVLSADAVRISVGMAVKLEQWGGEALDGVVKLVEPVGYTEISALGVEEQRVLVIVDITSAPSVWRSLGDGYRVEARFILWHDEHVLNVPASSLFRDQAGWAVYVVSDSQLQLRSVTVGHHTGLKTQILEGLEAGELVVTHPSDSLSDGSSVRLR